MSLLEYSWICGDEYLKEPVNDWLRGALWEWSSVIRGALIHSIIQN